METLNIFNELNKLFCTFTSADDLQTTINKISTKYSIVYNKMFILKAEQSDELICTYNIDTGNMNGNPMPNTILMHRKKESNTLYTINALNSIIVQLNNGYLDKNYKINWSEYKNSILLTNKDGFRRLDTKIYDIIEF